MKTGKSIALMIVLLTVFSCNKNLCKECHYEDEDGNEVEIGEKCNDEIEDAEANGHVVGDSTYSVHCGEH